MPNTNQTIYVAVDIETDGPDITKNSMRSLAAQCILPSGRIVGEPFSVNIRSIEDRNHNAKTMQFWAKFPDAWEDLNKNPKYPHTAMGDFMVWVGKMSDTLTPVLISDAISFEHGWINSYFQYTGINDPFDRQYEYIKSLVAAYLKIPTGELTKKDWPKHWESKLPHTHIAREDVAQMVDELTRILPDIFNYKAT